MDRLARLPIVLSAVLPLILAPEPGKPVSLVIGVGSWLVFVFDFIVHERLLQKYLTTSLGKFDLAIVVLTAPWFLLPGASGGGGFIVILRLARLARLLVGSRGLRQLISRLGHVALVAVSVMLGGAVIAYYAEHPVNPEYATFGDSIWWSIVTLTTVGYGDITPITTTGRMAAVMIMITGVAVLGLLAGSLASFFRLQPDGSASEPATPEGAADPPATAVTGSAESTAQADLDRVLSEISRLRVEVGDLSPLKAQLAQLTGSGADARSLDRGLLGGYVVGNLGASLFAESCRAVTGCLEKRGTRQ
jgi:voltage-gated potassium channel